VKRIFHPWVYLPVFMVHISVIYPSFAFGLRPILSYGGPKKKKKVRVQMRHKTGPKDYPLGD